MPDITNQISGMKAVMGRMQLEGRLQVMPGGDFREHARCTDVVAKRDAPLIDAVPVESEEVSKEVTRRRRKQTVKDAAVREFLRERAKGGESESSASLVSMRLARARESASIPSLTITKAKWPLWRDAGDKVRAAYYQQALEAMGSSYLFHLRLSNELMALAYTNPQAFTDYLRRRVSLNLKRSLGRKVDFWFAVEADRARFPHLHGALGIREDELKAVRKPLYKAAGLTGKGRFAKHALQIKKPTNGIGAAGYATKNLARTRWELGVNCLTTTNPVKRVAAVIYSDDRAVMLDHSGAGAVGPRKAWPYTTEPRLTDKPHTDPTGECPAARWAKQSECQAISRQ